MHDAHQASPDLDSGWRRHLKWMLGTLVALLGVAIGLIAVANPYGNLPISVLGRHVIMDDNQRYQYPAIIRTRRFDSLVIGTSTSRLFAPADLSGIFGGTFANLALNSGTPWEQWQTVRLFRRTVEKHGTLLVGLDHVWCDAEADRKRITPRGFPEWMYDDDRWNDLAYMLNTRSLEIAGRRIGHALGLVKARWPDDGYEVFVPPESAYDAARARAHIWAPGASRDNRAATSAANAGRTAMAFPALDWLAEILADKDGWRRIVLVITPVHVAALPAAGSEAAAREDACKARIRALALRHGVPLVDFRTRSPITTRDDNYWDALHFRVPVAARVVTAIGVALARGESDAETGYVVTMPRPAAN